MAHRFSLETNLEFQVVGDGYLVSESGSDWVHFLNHTAMLIILHCDGSTTAEQIAVSLQRIHRLAAPPTVEVEEVLVQLEAQGVVRQLPPALSLGQDPAPSENIITERERAHA